MVTFMVGGMTCDHCVRAVTDAVKGVVADAEVTVSLETGAVTVASRYDIPADKVAAAIADEGYDVKQAA